MMAINWDSFIHPDINELIWNFLELGIFFVLLFFGLFYLRLFFKKRKENRIQATFNIGYSIFFLVQCLNQVFYIFLSVSNGTIKLSPEVHSYLTNEMDLILIGMDEPLFALDFQIVYMMIFFVWSFLAILYPTEKYLRQQKRYIVSMLLLISSIGLPIILAIAHFLPPYAAIGDGVKTFLGILHPPVMIIVVLAFLVGMIVSVVFYIILGVKTTGTLRKKSFATAFGFIIWFLSVVVGNLLKPKLSGAAILLGPIMFYIGTFVLSYSFIRKE